MLFRTLSFINTRYAFGDKTDNLIVDRICPPGDLIRRQGLRSEERTDIPHFCLRNIRNINHKLIHTDTACDRGAFSAHLDPAARIGAKVAVCIADRQGRDTRLALCNKLAPIADRLSGLDGLNVDDSRAELHARTKINRARHLIRGPETILDDAGAYHINVDIGDLKDRRRLCNVLDGDMNARRLNGIAGFLKEFDLLFGKRLIRNISECKVGENAF